MNIDNNPYKDAFTESWTEYYPCKNPIKLGSIIKKDKHFLDAINNKIRSDLQKKKKLTKYGCLISINPDKSITMDNFLAFRNLVQRKVCKKKWAKDAIVVYEQRTDSLVPPWSGFHCHLLINFVDKIRPYKVNAIKEISQSMSPHASYNFNVDYQYLPTIEDYNKAHDYLSGYKADKKKRLRHRADLAMRKHFNIN